MKIFKDGATQQQKMDAALVFNMALEEFRALPNEWNQVRDGIGSDRKDCGECFLSRVTRRAQEFGLVGKDAWNSRFALSFTFLMDSDSSCWVYQCHRTFADLERYTKWLTREALA